MMRNRKKRKLLEAHGRKKRNRRKNRKKRKLLPYPGRNLLNQLNVGEEGKNQNLNPVKKNVLMVMSSEKIGMIMKIVKDVSYLKLAERSMNN